jgi:hypothetical protein
LATKPKVSAEEWRSTLDRFESYEKKKAAKRESKKKELAQEEVKDLRPVPDIDPHSKKLIQNQEPLIERMFINWKESIKKLQQSREQAEVAAQKTLKDPQINGRSKEMVRSPKIREEWFEMKRKRLQEEREKKKEMEDKALQKLFKPQIDEKSTKV